MSGSPGRFPPSRMLNQKIYVVDMPTHKAVIELPEQATSFAKDYLKLHVRDMYGEHIGTISDLAIKMGEEFPSVTSIVVSVKVRVSLLGRARFEAIIPWRFIKKCDEEAITLKIGFSEVKPGKLDKGELLLGKHVMDQQIVDHEGRKLLRVNDVKLKPDGHHIRLVGVETGIKGLLYRLGAGKKLTRIAKILNVKIMENIIMWDLVEQFDDEMKRIKLAISQEMLKDLINL
jgi:magnesium transporter